MSERLNSAEIAELCGLTQPAAQARRLRQMGIRAEADATLDAPPRN